MHAGLERAGLIEMLQAARTRTAMQLFGTIRQLRATTWLLLGLQTALASLAGTAAGGADQPLDCLRNVQLAAGLACAGAGLAICWMVS